MSAQQRDLPAMTRKAAYTGDLAFDLRLAHERAKRKAGATHRQPEPLFVRQFAQAGWIYDGIHRFAREPIAGELRLEGLVEYDGHPDVNIRRVVDNTLARCVAIGAEPWDETYCRIFAQELGAAGWRYELPASAEPSRGDSGGDTPAAFYRPRGSRQA